jgi:hypothetical protein
VSGPQPGITLPPRIAGGPSHQRERASGSVSYPTCHLETRIAVRPRNGTITIPAEARRAHRLDLPGARVEVILRGHDLILLPRRGPSEAGPRRRVRRRPTLASTSPGVRWLVASQAPRAGGYRQRPPGLCATVVIATRTAAKSCSARSAGSPRCPNSRRSSWSTMARPAAARRRPSLQDGADLLDMPAGGLLGAVGVTGLAGCSCPIRPIPALLSSGS